MSSSPTATNESGLETRTTVTTGKYTEEDDSPVRDDEGRTTDRTLLRYSHSHPVPFNRGHSDLFVISNQPRLSSLTDAEIHYNPRDAPDTPWKLLNCYIYHHELGKLYNFEVSQAESKENLIILKVVEEPVQIIPSRLDNPFE